MLKDGIRVKKIFPLTAAGDRHETEHAVSHGDETEFFGRLQIQSCREGKTEKREHSGMQSALINLHCVSVLLW